MKSSAALANWHQLSSVPISAESNAGIAVPMSAILFPYIGFAWTFILTSVGVTADTTFL